MNFFLGFLKLSLKKNVGNDKKDTQKCKGSSDIMVIDDSFDRLMSQYSNNVSMFMVSYFVMQPASVTKLLYCIYITHKNNRTFFLLSA